MSNRYFTPTMLTPFTRARAESVNPNLRGFEAACEKIQLEMDSGANLTLGPNLLSTDPAKGDALVMHGGETVKAVLDKLTNPAALAAAGTLTGSESLALFNGTTLVNLALNRLLYKDVNGAVTAGPSMTLAGPSFAVLNLKDEGAAANQKYMRLLSDGGTLAIDAVNDAYTVPTTRMLITAGGLFGINKTNPSFTFDVNGQIRGSGTVGALTASNGSVSDLQASVLIRKEGASSTQKDWEILHAAGNGAFILRTVNDAYSDAQAAITVLRGAGVAVDSIFLGTGGANRWFVSNAGVFAPVNDNVYSLGTGSLRATVVYAATGTINTSDEREKTWRGGPTDAELRAARSISAELGFYQWNDAIAEKGPDGARYHFGVRAQRAFAILEDEGLDWRRYAWCCYDRWDRETKPIYATRTVTLTRQVEYQSRLVGNDGQPIIRTRTETYEEEETYDTGDVEITLEAGDRYGVRPDQLCLFLIAALAN